MTEEGQAEYEPTARALSCESAPEGLGVEEVGWSLFPSLELWLPNFRSWEIRARARLKVGQSQLCAWVRCESESPHSPS